MLLNSFKDALLLVMERKTHWAWPLFTSGHVSKHLLHHHHVVTELVVQRRVLRRPPVVTVIRSQQCKLRLFSRRRIRDTPRACAAR